MKDRIILKAIGDFKFGRKGSKKRDIELKQFDLFYQGRSERSDITYDYDHIMRRSSGTTSSSVRHYLSKGLAVPYDIPKNVVYDKVNHRFYKVLNKVRDTFFKEKELMDTGYRPEQFRKGEYEPYWSAYANFMIKNNIFYDGVEYGGLSTEEAIPLIKDFRKRIPKGMEHYTVKDEEKQYGFHASRDSKTWYHSPEYKKVENDYFRIANKYLKDSRVGTDNVSPTVLKMIQSRPQDFRVNEEQVINTETGQFDSRSKYFKKGGKKIKGSATKLGFKSMAGGIAIEREQRIKATKSYKGLQSLYHTPKHQNQKASIFQQYQYFTDVPTDIEQFKADILNAYEVDFSSKDKTRPNQKVVLTFGQPSEFRVFPLDGIEDLSWMIDNFQAGEEGKWGGSDLRDFDGESVVRNENLNLDFFRIILSGTPTGGGGSNKTTTKSKWFWLNQPKTTNNECLEGAIKRFIESKQRVSTLRFDMVQLGLGIEFGNEISLEQLPFYEDAFGINIWVYLDKPHCLDGELENNLLRKGQMTHDKTMKVLLKDSHYSLISGTKKNIKQITKPDARMLGLNKNGDKSVIKLLNEAAAKENGIDTKNLKEIAVIFDNETIFDKSDENFLKVYGVSWFLWDFNKHFDYDDGWLNEEKTENKYHEEPYCYYKRGENCIDELIRFLLNPPEGVVYRPMGFNNSRFDNYSFCESAMKFKVLEDIFMADGSILYTRIRGIKNVWDSSRFLVGSLAGACKNYGTNPKKMPDLINHYEIQCFYELNGWEGLNKLLDSKKSLVLYNKIDCICLADLIQKMRNAYIDMFDEDVFDNLTISSMGYKICCDKWSGQKEYKKELVSGLGYENGEIVASKEDKKMLKDKLKTYKDKFYINKANSFEDDLFHRSSMFAGRTQSFFGKIDISMPLAMCDVKSLYPTVMGSYGGDCPMPYGAYTKTDTFVEGKLGIYRCKLKHQRCLWKNKPLIDEAFSRTFEETGWKPKSNKSRMYAPNVIPFRSPEVGVPLDWFYRGEMDLVLTSVDIEVLKWATEDEDCIEIFEGHYWSMGKTDLFIDFLEPAKAEKTRQDRLKEEDSNEYNQAKREGCKMISNSLSGKLLEAIHENVSSLFSISTYCDMEKDEKISELQIQDFGCGFSLVNGKKSKKDVFEDTEKGKRKPAYLGMFVYSYARKLMYEKLLAKYLVFYMDTDSACMPLFEWERCKSENATNGLIETGEYGCLEEEVCYTDKKTGEFFPADRLIGIAPKNYFVGNSKKDFMSKRKFKGVRKTDVWLPLEHFGEYKLNEKGKAEGKAIDFIRGNKSNGVKSMNQDDIRAMREYNCCASCINKIVLEDEEECIRCKNMSKLMKPAYSDEMFEELVNCRKIVVFCSMINRIKYRCADTTSSNYIEKLGSEMSVSEMEAMCIEGSNQPIEYTITHTNMKLWKKAKKKFKEENPNMNNEQLKEEFVGFFQRFRQIKNEKELDTMFKLRQMYMVKII